MNPLLTEQTRVVASTNQVSAPVSKETVILGMTDGVYYGLDAVGTRIWELVQEPRTLSELASTIESEFDVNRDEALADLFVFCGDLRGRGLLEVAPDSPPR